MFTISLSFIVAICRQTLLVYIQEMVRSKLPNTALAKVWRLADYDKDGQLTEEEFALAMHLINVRLEGHALPDDLPDHLIPPSQRSMFHRFTIYLAC